MELRVTLYTKPDCHLCEDTEALLNSYQEEYPHQLAIVDISNSEELQQRFGEQIPVLEIGSYRLFAPIDPKRVQMLLGAATDKLDNMTERERKAMSNRRKRADVLSQGDKFSYWFAKNYMAVVNIFLLLYVGLPFLAPVLMQAGMPRAAAPIYKVYGGLCHQLSYRSWFLFGDQVAYPRTAAGVDGLATFEEATGINEDGLIPARNFIGNEEVGYKVAFCERDVAIYAAMFLFGIAYVLTKRRIPALPWYLWLIIGMGPIGLDGFSQLLSQIPNWPLWDYRESTPFLRTLTGGIFGLMTAWFGFPVLDETFQETRMLIEKKMSRLKYLALQKGEEVDW